VALAGGAHDANQVLGTRAKRNSGSSQNIQSSQQIGDLLPFHRQPLQQLGLHGRKGSALLVWLLNLATTQSGVEISDPRAKSWYL
jgi:hypothetical protein